METLHKVSHLDKETCHLSFHSLVEVSISLEIYSSNLPAASEISIAWGKRTVTKNAENE